MIPLLASLLASAQAIPEPPPPVEPIRPPYYSCGVERTDALGTVRANQFVFPNGVRDEPVFSWDAQRAPDGIGLHAVWGLGGPQDDDFVQIDYEGGAPDAVYRIQVRRSETEAAGELHLQSGFKRPEDGVLRIVTAWGPLRAVVATAPEPRLVVLSAGGDVLRSDPVDPAAFGRAMEAAASLQPELAALVEDYRNRCTWVESLGAP